ncbi:MAG: hypothetical protein COY40_05925 [Alphaproteobacteria bacterium CG_4_10_14_0_8_um_filter_53_9]|nr:MAG: hypothetical protein COY40_05925 [Alphaproteobacteria bacterium CG_4_10_14_0_8_um_filter_53_9]
MQDVISFTTNLMPTTVTCTTSYPLSKEGPLGLYDVDISRVSLIQVLTNLLKNAAYAMGNIGEIEIKIRLKSLSMAESARHAIPQGLYVHVQVKDSGNGIPSGILTHIFEPFYTSKNDGEGTGLGLSISYGMVRNWGGDIFATSKTNEGTIMSFYIPISQNIEEVGE